MIIKDHEFDGWDWYELAEYFVVPCGDYDDKCCEKLQTHLKTIYDKTLFNDPNCQEEVELCRKYLDKLIERMVEIDSVIDISLWQGLAKIEDDATFLRYYIDLLPYMWT